MQASFKQFFQKESMLFGSIIAASTLWIVNAGFNIADGDYRAFCIDLLYVVCLITLGGSFKGKNEKVMEGMIGALLMICVVGNVNVLSEMLDTAIPSRSLWQLVCGAILTIGLFVNHFMISRDDRRTLWRIQINQILIMVLLLFRVFQILMNIAFSGFSVLLIEVSVGMLAIVPTMNVIACIESQTESYTPAA